MSCLFSFLSADVRFYVLGWALCKDAQMLLNFQNLKWINVGKSIRVGMAVLKSQLGVNHKFMVASCIFRLLIVMPVK